MERYGKRYPKATIWFWPNRKDCLPWPLNLLINCDTVEDITVKLGITWVQIAFINTLWPENNRRPRHFFVGSKVSYCPDKNDLFGELTPFRNRLTVSSIIIQYSVNSNTVFMKSKWKIIYTVPDRSRKGFLGLSLFLVKFVWHEKIKNRGFLNIFCCWLTIWYVYIYTDFELQGITITCMSALIDNTIFQQIYFIPVDTHAVKGYWVLIGKISGDFDRRQMKLFGNIF